jgi:hypothetical protein
MIQKTWLQSRCLEMGSCSDSGTIQFLAARHNIYRFDEYLMSDEEN